MSKNFNLITVDRKPSDHTNIISCISSPSFVNKLSKSETYSVVHLAASRFDFGIKSKEYYEENVNCTKKFIQNIKDLNISFFLHFSSVAVFQGQKIPFIDSLKCDDAYRSTKFIQSEVIEEFCLLNNIKLCILLPSAIYSDQRRTDTNISKLKNLSKILPFIPKIDVFKSITNLDHLCKFTNFLLTNEKTGKFMVIDYPTKTVTDIISDCCGQKKITIYIPFLRYILYICAFIFTNLLNFKYITINRVKKLYSDTSYDSFKEKYNYNSYLGFLKNNNE